MEYSPVIVVVAFNRTESVERLLFSLGNAKKISKAKLIISIDNNAPENYRVRDIAHDFHWPFGEKEVIYHKERLGLRKHILQCGDYAIQHGSVIILEDDLFVSPYFYEYTVQALNYYDHDQQIGGISLYNYPYQDIIDLPFCPINDDSDVYFIKTPSSWGQAWTKKQWENFRMWYNNNPDITQIPIHSRIINWPETSWKKYFAAYLESTGKYFVYPRVSLTTNFNDPGAHLKLDINYDGQTQLRLTDAPYRFKNLIESYCIYDSYFELNAGIVKMFASELRDYEFEMDLYGIKALNKIKLPYIITSKPAKNALTGFKRELKPHEMNVLLGLKGDDLLLCQKKDVLPVKKRFKKSLSDFQYFYTSYLPSGNTFLYDRLIRNKFFSKFIK